MLRFGGCGDDRLIPERCTHPWLDNTIEPYCGPERPGFLNNWFSGPTNLHNADSWGLGVDKSPIFAPSTMIYGFKRQTNGRFAEPFYFFYDENDAIVNESGLSLMPHGDGSDDVQSLHDVYTSEINLGQNNILGSPHQENIELAAYILNMIRSVLLAKIHLS
jgi:hypothetical protein